MSTVYLLEVITLVVILICYNMTFGAINPQNKHTIKSQSQLSIAT